MPEDLDPALAELDAARRAFYVAAGRLRTAIHAVCPQHRPVQHRDRKPPWCPWCGMSDDGLIRRDLTTP